MRSRARKLADQIGRRGAALLFFALLDLVYGYALLTPPRPLPAVYAWAATLIPLQAWGWCWIGAGTVCLVYAFRRYDSIAFTIAVGLKVTWALLALLGWMAGAIDRGWLSAVIWFGFALFVYLIAGGIPAPEVTRGGRGWIRRKSPR